MMLRLAWRNMWRHGRRSLITAGALAVGAAFTLALVALSDGMFVLMFDALVGQSLGHVQVHDPEYPTRKSVHATLDEAETLAALDGLDAAVGVAPRVLGFSLLAAGEKASGGQLRGVDPTREPKVTQLHEKVYEGRYLADEPAKEILLGKGLAETLKVGVGDEVVAVTQAADGSLGNDLYTVVGLLMSGSALLDQGGAVMHLEDLQDLLVLPGRIHEVAMRTESGDQVPVLSAQASAALAGTELLVRPWNVVDPMSGQMMAMQDTSIGILLIIVFSVAALGVLNTMLMSVFERTKEFGVLQAIGLKPWKLLQLVLWESALLSLLAGLMGTVLGLLMDWWLVVKGIDLSMFTDGYTFSGVFFEPVMYGQFRVDRVVMVVVAMVLLSVMASIWPAARAARLDPVVAMREDG